MIYKAPLEDADGIDSFALSEIEKLKWSEKRASASAVLAKYNEEEVVLKEMLYKHWDEEGKKF